MTQQATHNVILLSEKDLMILTGGSFNLKQNSYTHVTYS